MEGLVLDDKLAESGEGGILLVSGVKTVYWSCGERCEGMVASSFKKGDKVYIGGDKLLPIERFLPKPKVVGGVTKRGRGRGGPGGRGGSRGMPAGRGFQRGGVRGRGGSRAGFGGNRGGGFRGNAGGRGGRGVRGGGFRG